MVGYKQPPSIERSQTIRSAFEAKVEILERWASEGVPAEVLIRAGKGGALAPEDYPRDNVKLRRWRGPAGDLSTWTDPLIDRPKTGKYPELTARFQRAVAGVDIWLAAKSGRMGELEAQVTVLSAEKERLQIQNATLLGRIARLEDRVAELETVSPRQRR